MGDRLAAPLRGQSEAREPVGRSQDAGRTLGSCEDTW